MNPRYIQTLDTDLQPISINVRIGQAVETVGQAGRPKRITGFQVCFFDPFSFYIFINLHLFSNKYRHKQLLHY